MTRVYTDIKGYDGLYKINELGEVYSVLRYIKFGTRMRKVGGKNKPIVINPKNGYACVFLSNRQKVKCHTLHRLIALHFIPNPDNKPEVNHINGIKTDNRIENLEWCTKSENSKHAFKIGLRKIIRNEDNSRSKKLGQYSKEGVLIKIWPSLNETERSGFSSSNIYTSIKNDWNAHGFKWRYLS